MLLRTSSSSGIKGSVFSVVSESPLDNPTSNFRHHHSPSHLNFPPPPQVINQDSSGGRRSRRRGGFRRAWSESNIDKFAAPPSSCDYSKQLVSLTPRRYPPKKTMLHSAPSFSVFTAEELEEVEQKDEGLVRTVTIGENIEGGDFSFGETREKEMGLIVEEDERQVIKDEEEEDDDDDDDDGVGRLGLIFTGTNVGGFGDENQPASPPMYLATGLGFDSIDFQSATGGDAASLLDFDESGDLEEYYRKMLDQFPSHTLFLTNYAHLLQSKGDLHGAEEYYHRATFLEPEDGDILMQYAKLVWELHHDRDRAKGLFERAAEAASEDSNVLAAYASFLWEISGGDDEDDNPLQMEQLKVENPIISGKEEVNNEVNVEEYYKRMVDENPNNALLLRNYAQFLSQSKGDLQGAEEYYSRAILADPRDGEIISQYAKLVWEVHQDHQKASSYFERSAQASPADSQVLAAYASFLWETEEDEDEETNLSGQFLGTVGREGAMVAAAN